MKKSRRLILHRETLRRLSGENVRTVAGGTGSLASICESICASQCYTCGGTSVPTKGETYCGTQEHTACTTHTE